METTICFPCFIYKRDDQLIKAMAIRQMKSQNEIRLELIRLGLKVEQEETTRKREIQRFRLLT